MSQLLLMTAILLITPGAFAQNEAAPNSATREDVPAATTPPKAKPDSELLRLDQSLDKARDDKSNGRLSEKEYQNFVAKFRGDLSETMERIKPSPENTALHARIISHLDDPRQALSELGPAIKNDPGNIDLRVAAGQVQLERKDYPAALAEANAALDIDPKNQEALMLKHFSQGRDSSSSRADAGQFSNPGFARSDWTIPAKNDISPQAMTFIRKGIEERRSGDMAGAQRDIQAAMNSDPTSKGVQEVYATMREDQTRQAETKSYVLNAAAAMKAGHGAEAVSWAQKAYDRTRSEETLAVLEKVRHDSAGLATKQAVNSPDEAPPQSRNNGAPLWPLFPAFILGGTAFTVIKSRKTVESEDGDNENTRPQPGEGQRFVAGALLAGMAGAGLYFAGVYAVSAGPQLLVKLMGGAEQPAAQRIGESTVEVAEETGGSFGQPIAQRVTKENARAVLDEMRLPPEQARAAIKAIQRATRSETITILTQRGGDILIKVTRPGRDGFQEFEHLVSVSGEKQVIQRAYDSSGNLAHYDPKTP
jgi:tetratricopeptide (TPR) repeat protein